VSSILEKIGHDWIIALSVFATAIFTATLWWSTRGMLRVTNDSIQLARQEFISSHRPEMRLKHIWLIGDIWSGQPIEVTLDIVNVGNTTGIIVNFNYVTLILPKIASLPQRPPYDEPDEPGSPRTYQFRDGFALASGITYPRSFCDGRTLTPKEIQDIRDGNLRLYFIGSIEYWDNAGARQTAFCRYITFSSYPPSPRDTGRFEKHCDPDYEYQD